MFDYSIEAFKIIIEDFKKWGKGFRIGFSIFTLFYLLYSLLAHNGFFYVNLVLITLYCAYTIFEIVTIKKNIKNVKKAVARTYKWTKILINAFTLGSLIYGIYLASTNIDGISIIFATLMIILWVLQVLMEVIILVAEPKIKFIKAGAMQDVKPIVKTVNKVKETFNGDKVFDYDNFEEEYEKELKILTPRVDKKRATKPKKQFEPLEFIVKEGGNLLNKAREKMMPLFKSKKQDKNQEEVILDDEEKMKKK